MTVNFTDLAASFRSWTDRAGMANATVATSEGGQGMLFKSDDEAYELRHDDGWWVVDEIDDRGRRYADTGHFSTIGLAQKYLLWRWASTARTALGAKQLGANYHSLGMNAKVDGLPSPVSDFVELHLAEGIAILPNSNAAMFSHILDMPSARIVQIVSEGLPG